LTPTGRIGTVRLTSPDFPHEEAHTMRQAILLEPADMDALTRGIGIDLTLGESRVTLMMATFTPTIPPTRNNGHAAAPPRSRRAPVRRDKMGRVITPAARASMLRNAANARKALAAKRRREAANGN
jgi:hypothetical protein